MSEHVIHKRLWWAARGCDSALDVGCGRAGKNSRPKYEVDTPLYWGIDRDVDPEASSPGRRLIRSDALGALAALADGAFDLVYALDFVEHLERAESERLVAEMIRIAAKRVVVATPNGFRPHDPGGPMAHLCGWLPAELRALGFMVEAVDFDYGLGHGVERASMLWAERGSA